MYIKWYQIRTDHIFDIMKIIKVSSGVPELSGLLLRQSPRGKGIWGDCQFIVNQPVERCDWWFVLHGSGLVSIEKTICDPKHIVYISMEPNENVGHITKKFLNQFSHLVICDREIIHKNITYSNGLTWWVGINVNHKNGQHIFDKDFTLDYNQLKILKKSEKINRISIIVSSKTFLNGHKKRLRFLNEITKLPIGKYIDVFGGGFNAIPEKLEAISPYKYHLVLENDIVKDYWSEKLADAFIGYSYPIYYGCPNISDYFSNDSLSVIDIDDVENTAKKLMQLIDEGIGLENEIAINMAREMILDKYNIFQLISNICIEAAESYKLITLRPNNIYLMSPLKRILKSIFQRVSQVKLKG